MSQKFLDQVKQRTKAKIIEILLDNEVAIASGEKNLSEIGTEILSIVEKGMMLAYHNAYEDGAYAINENYQVGEKCQSDQQN
jgi:hypothetical protein